MIGCEVEGRNEGCVCVVVVVVEWGATAIKVTLLKFLWLHHCSAWLNDKTSLPMPHTSRLNTHCSSTLTIMLPISHILANFNASAPHLRSLPMRINLNIQFQKELDVFKQIASSWFWYAF
jgi:hypothetical protein